MDRTRAAIVVLLAGPLLLAGCAEPMSECTRRPTGVHWIQPGLHDHLAEASSGSNLSAELPVLLGLEGDPAPELGRWFRSAVSDRLLARHVIHHIDGRWLLQTWRNDHDVDQTALRAEVEEVLREATGLDERRIDELLERHPWHDLHPQSWHDELPGAHILARHIAGHGFGARIEEGNWTVSFSHVTGGLRVRDELHGMVVRFSSHDRVALDHWGPTPDSGILAPTGFPVADAPDWLRARLGLAAAPHGFGVAEAQCGVPAGAILRPDVRV